MAPKATKRNQSPPHDSQGIFAGMIVFLIENGVQNRRLQIWKQKLFQMGAKILEGTLSTRVTHVFAANADSVQQFGRQRLSPSKAIVLRYQWLEDSLKLGDKVSEESYILSLDTGDSVNNSLEEEVPKSSNKNNSSSKETILKSARSKKSSGDETSPRKKIRASLEESKNNIADGDKTSKDVHDASKAGSDSDDSFRSLSQDINSPIVHDAQDKTVDSSESSLPYSPPDLNKNITVIFGKLINIYRALGDDRRSFSYYKAIPIIEKLPFKVESVDQVKHLPAIGKAMQDHIQEIVTTGKLSKLEHFETDEKIRTISLFGEVWGIGPATALKLYDKGHRTLDDLKNEDSLTNAQRLGLKYFDDINTRIPRHEVQEMELLLQKAGTDILPGVVVLCGGSFRRGKASCGDMDIVITHPDGKSHVGFLPKYIMHLKDIKFLREDLVFSIHSEEGTDSGVDTYFGLCTYPSQELRHRIDFKVYPKDIYAFGLLAWTGNDVLNRRLRLLAESKGFRLDDTGLFPATQSSGNRRGSRGMASLKFGTEKEVFDFLGFPWLEPHQRNL